MTSSAVKSKSMPRRVATVSALALATLSLMLLVSCTSLELGSRPAESLKPVVAAPDVKFIDANGLRLAYLEEGTGPLVLLLHGFPLTPRSWGGVQQRLVAAGYRVVAPYSRGYPPSGFPADGDYAITSLAADVLALIDALGEQSAIVVGHDWGAAAAYAAATVQPAKVRQMVAIGTPHPLGVMGDKSFFLEAPHFIYYQFPWAERLVWSHDFAHIEEVYKRGSVHYKPPAALMADVKATLRGPGAVEAAIGYYRAAVKTREADRARAQQPISAPSLVIAGVDDGSFRPARFDKATAAFTGPYRLLKFDNVGHYPQLEATDQTVEAILSFVRGTP